MNNYYYCYYEAIRLVNFCVEGTFHSFCKVPQGYYVIKQQSMFTEKTRLQTRSNIADMLVQHRRSGYYPTLHKSPETLDILEPCILSHAPLLVHQTR